MQGKEPTNTNLRPIFPIDSLNDGGKEKHDSVASSTSLNDDSKDKHESVVVDSSLASTPTPNTTAPIASAPPPTKLNFETTKLNFETTKLNFDTEKVVTTTMSEATKTTSTTPPDDAATAPANISKMQVNTIINTVNGVKAELMPALNSETSGDAIVMDKENVSHLNSNANDADAVVKIEQAVR